MPGTPTTRYAIPTLAGSTLARDIDTEVNAGLSAIDSKMVGYSEGPIGSRPTSTGGTPGIAGRIYGATDRPGRYDLDHGSGWDMLLRADMILAPYRPLHRAATFWQDTDSAGARYFDSFGSGLMSTLSGLGVAAGILYFDPADHALADLTTRIRVRAWLSGNSFGSGTTTFAASLVPITPGGGADVVTFTPGAAVATAPAFSVNANSSATSVSSDVSPPAAGLYALSVALSGAPAANGKGLIGVQLEVHHV